MEFTESGPWDGRAWGRAGELLNGDRASVRDDEQVLKMDGGEGCSTL